MLYLQFNHHLILSNVQSGQIYHSFFSPFPFYRYCWCFSLQSKWIIIIDYANEMIFASALTCFGDRWFCCLSWFYPHIVDATYGNLMINVFFFAFFFLNSFITTHAKSKKSIRFFFFWHISNSLNCIYLCKKRRFLITNQQQQLMCFTICGDTSLVSDKCNV